MLINVITTPSGDEMVVIPRADYDALIDAADEASDLALMKSRRGEPTMSHDLVMAVLTGNMRLMEAWRKQRGMTQAQLAAKVNVRPATISDIESGKSHGRFDIMQRVARALGVGLDDLASEATQTRTGGPMGPPV